MEPFLAVIKQSYQWVIDNKEWLFSGIGGLMASWLSAICISRYKTKTTMPLPHKVNKNTTGKKILPAAAAKQPDSIYFNDIDTLIARFLELYSIHRIPTNNIPDLIDRNFNLKIGDFSTKEAILNVLTGDLLQWISTYWGIQRGWLEGTAQRIYPYRNYYKNVGDFISLVVNLKYREEKTVVACFYKNGTLDHSSEKQQNVVLVLQYPIGEINGKTLYGYIPVSTQWNWGYWRTRYQLKSIIYILQKLRISTCGYDLDLESMGQLVDGTIYPEPIVNRISQYTWYPEDYIDLPSESSCCKETAETHEVRKYIDEEGYSKHLQNEAEKQVAAGFFCLY